MNIDTPLFGLIVPLLLVIVAVAVVVSIVRRRGREEADAGIGSIKRFYYYGVSFVSLMVAANGLVLLVRYVVDSLRGGTVVTSSSQLALGLALSIVGTPIWLLFWSMAQRSVGQSTTETRSLMRKFYIYLVLGISLGYLATGTVSLLRAILGAIGFEGNHLAQPLIWGGLWAYHWRVESLEGQPGDDIRSLRRVYLYLASVASLTMLTAGLAIVLRQMLLAVYDALLSRPVLVDVSIWSNVVRTAAATAAIGACGWWWHWHRASRRDAGSLLRAVYLYLFTILGGAATVVVSSSILLYTVLQWLMGAPDIGAAGEHFRMVPGVLAAMLAGGAVWGYHSMVLKQESEAAAGRVAGAKRVYRYLLASLGLGALATSLVILISMAISLAVAGARDTLAVGGWWKNALSLVLTLLVVGVSIWGYFWRKAQAEASRSAEERGSTTRRVFIYAIFGIAVLIALGSLSSVLYFLLQDLLKGELSADVLRNAKWGLGILMATGAISVYYWLVLQEDRGVLAPLEAVAKQAPARKAVTVLASESAMSLVERLEAGLGYKVVRWRSVGPDETAPALSDEQLQAVVERIAQASTSQVLVVVDAEGVRVMPYEEE